MRPGFEGYGAVAYFDEAAALLEIHWCAGDGGNGTAVRPGDAGWAHAKWAFKTTAFSDEGILSFCLPALILYGGSLLKEHIFGGE